MSLLRMVASRWPAMPAVALLPVVLSACGLYPHVMSADAMFGLEVQPVSVEGGTELHITGMCGSAEDLLRVECAYHGDAIVMRVMVVAARFVHGVRLRIAMAVQDRQGRRKTLQRHHCERKEEDESSGPAAHVFSV